MKKLLFMALAFLVLFSPEVYAHSSSHRRSTHHVRLAEEKPKAIVPAVVWLWNLDWRIPQEVSNQIVITRFTIVYGGIDFKGSGYSHEDFSRRFPGRSLDSCIRERISRILFMRIAVLPEVDRYDDHFFRIAPEDLGDLFQDSTVVFVPFGTLYCETRCEIQRKFHVDPEEEEDVATTGIFASHLSPPGH